MLDRTTANLEKNEPRKPGTDTSTLSKLSHEVQEAQRAKASTNATPESSHVASFTSATAKMNLPHLTLVHSQAPASSWFSSIEKSAQGVMNVAGDIGKGAINEAIHHPGTLLKDAAVGAAVGAATVVGLALLPEGLAGAAIVGGAVAVGGAIAGGIELAKHGGNVDETVKAVAHGAKDIVHRAENLGHSISVDYDRSQYSEVAQHKAEKAVQKIGAAGAEAAAGTLGAVAGGAGALLLKGAISATTADATSSAVVNDAPSGLGMKAANPFTLEDTSMTVTKPDVWADIVAKNGAKSYGAAIIRFANNWATTIEKNMAAGQPMTAEMVNAAENSADTEGISGSMYSFAKSALYDTWKYGSNLKVILDANHA